MMHYSHGINPQVAEFIELERTGVSSAVTDIFKSALAYAGFVTPLPTREATPDELFQMVQHDPNIDEVTRASFVAELTSGADEDAAPSRELQAYIRQNPVYDTTEIDRENNEYIF